MLLVLRFCVLGFQHGDWVEATVEAGRVDDSREDPGNEVAGKFIHDSRHVGFAIIMQMSDTHLRGQTTQV